MCVIIFPLSFCTTLFREYTKIGRTALWTICHLARFRQNQDRWSRFVLYECQFASLQCFTLLTYIEGGFQTVRLCGHLWESQVGSPPIVQLTSDWLHDMLEGEGYQSIDISFLFIPEQPDGMKNYEKKDRLPENNMSFTALVGYVCFNGSLSGMLDRKIIWTITNYSNL